MFDKNHPDAIVLFCLTCTPLRRLNGALKLLIILIQIEKCKVNINNEFNFRKYKDNYLLSVRLGSLRIYIFPLVTSRSPLVFEHMRYLCLCFALTNMLPLAWGRI